LHHETNRSLPRIIAFIGLVGGGKSTQIKFLASALRKNRLKVKTTSLKTNHLFASFLTLILARTLAGKRKDVSRIRALLEERPLIYGRLFWLWLYLDAISVSIQFLISVYIPSKIGYVVLVEEYIPATISDYLYLGKALNLPPRVFCLTMNWMLKLMHSGGPIQMVFLDADVDVLRFRWKKRGSLNEKSDYLGMQRTTLLSLSKKLSLRILCFNTTNQTIRETHEKIVGYLMSTT
jgi:thymidylate kinase